MKKKEAILLEILSGLKIISGGEQWESQYKKDPASFQKLVHAETILEHHLKDYFSSFWMRISKFIDMKKYRTQAIKAYDVAVDVNTDVFKEEIRIFLKFVVADVSLAMEAGAQAGIALTHLDIGLSTLNNAILESLNSYAPDVIKGITDTTRKLINNSLTTSINLGETDQEAMNRLQEYILDPDRALMIARTESVRAYSKGLMTFAMETGATQKRWRTTPGACPICSPNDGQVVDINDTFNSGDDYPPSHPNCRCTYSLIYPKGNEA